MHGECVCVCGMCMYVCGMCVCGVGPRKLVITLSSLTVALWLDTKDDYFQIYSVKGIPTAFVLSRWSRRNSGILGVLKQDFSDLCILILWQHWPANPGSESLMSTKKTPSCLEKWWIPDASGGIDMRNLEFPDISESKEASKVTSQAQGLEVESRRWRERRVVSQWGNSRDSSNTFTPMSSLWRWTKNLVLVVR